jgi:hypothetical protein
LSQKVQGVFWEIFSRVLPKLDTSNSIYPYYKELYCTCQDKVSRLVLWIAESQVTQ